METIELVSAGAYLLSILVSIIMGGFFYREYSSKKLKPSAAWAFGFSAYALGQMLAIYIGLTGAARVPIIISMIFVAGGMTLFYYGASLLFFGPGSFFREKLASLVFLLYMAYIAYIAVNFPPLEVAVEEIRLPMLMPVAIIALAVSYLFFRVGRRLAPEDPRKKTVFMVALGFLLNAFANTYFGFLWGEIPTLEVFIHGISVIAWILILYGMVLGRAART